MIKILSIMLLVFPVTLLAQQKFIVKGHLGDIGPSAKIYLTYRDFDTKKVDSADIVNGNYQFKGMVKDVTFAELVINYKHAGLSKRYRTDGSNTYNFYLAAGITDVSSKDTLSNGKISGSAINTAGMQYDSMLTNVRKKKQAVITEFFKTDKSSSKRATYSAKLSVLKIQYDSLSFAFIRRNKTNYMSLIILENMAGPKPNPKEIRPVFNSLSTELQNTTAGKRLAALLASVTSTNIGDIALDFTMPDTANVKVKLSAYKGKYVLLDFWASWCAPCRQENPNLVKTYEKYKNKNFTVLSVSLDSKRDNWLKAIREDHLRWTHVSDLKYWNNEAAIKYGINAVPANFLIDPNGVIVGINLRGEALENKLKELIK
jgi:peroxiredoxin